MGELRGQLVCRDMRIIHAIPTGVVSSTARYHIWRYRGVFYDF